MSAIWEYRQLVLRGIEGTLVVFFAAAILAVLLAFLVGLMRLSRFMVVRALANTYVEIFRGLSLLIELFILFYVLPEFGILMPPFATAVLAIGLCFGAYGSEIVRGTIQALGQSQQDAAIALNLPTAKLFWFVTLPLACRQMLPLFGNLLIELLKSTALVSLITLHDLSFEAAVIHRLDNQTIGIFTTVLLIYFLFAQIIGRSCDGQNANSFPGRFDMTFDWNLLRETAPLLLAGAKVTLIATLGGMTIAIFGGLALHLLREHHNPLIARPAAFFIEFVRSTPLLIQIYFIFFLGPYIGITMSAFLSGLVAIGVHESCYAAEIYRAGIGSVPRGLWDASKALNFSRTRTYSVVILPMAMRPILPAFGNLLISMFKDTPLLSTIGVAEMMFHATLIGADRFQYTEVMLFAGFVFLILSLGASLMVRALERHMAIKVA